MCGWIKIHRDLQKHWLAQDFEKLGWWVDMLLLASYEDNKVLVKNRIASLKRGQFVGSLSFFSMRWHVSRDRVSTFLKLLEADGMITRQLVGHIQQITICNYESYQDVPDSSPTVSLQFADSLPTDCRQTKEIKEIQEINNNISSARTREERPSWDGSSERGFLERYKAQGCGVSLARATGKRAAEIMELLDVFLAECETRNIGHTDFDHFNNHFIQAVKNNKLVLPSKDRKVIEGAAIFNLYK